MMDPFDKFITPILNYACEIWGFHPSPAIEKIHLSFCKRILSVKKSTQNDFIYGELGRYPLQLIRYEKIIKYWLNIVTGQKSSYVCLIYRYAVNQAERRKPSWALNVKSLLCNVGMGEAWYNQGVGHPGLFIGLLKQRLRDNFVQDWHSRLESSPRARFYRSIKDNFGRSLYLDKICVKQLRVSMVRLLVSSHSLHIETGRWRRPDPTPPEERFCPHCPQEIEDEYHVIMKCTLYSQERNRLIPTKFWRRPSMQNLKNLINTSNKKTVVGLAKFIALAFRKREQLYRQL